jgi:hypothetical protein
MGCFDHGTGQVLLFSACLKKNSDSGYGARLAADTTSTLPASTKPG